MKDFFAENSSYIFARKTGLSWLARLSTLTVVQAQFIDWHAHKDVEVIVCHKGSARYEFVDRAPITITSGCILVIPPHTCHRISGGIDSTISRSSIFLHPYRKRMPDKDFFTPAEYRKTILARLLEKSLCPFRLPFEVERSAKAMPALIRKGAALAPLENLRLRAIVVNTVLGAASADRAPVRTPSNDIVSDALRWIENRLGSPFALNELVTHIGYSRSRFCAIFKSHTGLTPLEWATNRRLEKAKELLSRGNSSVSAIARAVGFRSPAFFAKTFRTHYGVIPSKWADA